MRGIVNLEGRKWSNRAWEEDHGACGGDQALRAESLFVVPHQRRGQGNGRGGKLGVGGASPHYAAGSGLVSYNQV